MHKQTQNIKLINFGLTGMKVTSDFKANLINLPKYKTVANNV